MIRGTLRNFLGITPLPCFSTLIQQRKHIMAQPRRAEEGTAKTLQLGYKIGGQFVVQSHGTAPFLKSRLELFEQMHHEYIEQNSLSTYFFVTFLRTS